MCVRGPLCERWFGGHSRCEMPLSNLESFFFLCFYIRAFSLHVGAFSVTAPCILHQYEPAAESLVHIDQEQSLEVPVHQCLHFCKMPLPYSFFNLNVFLIFCNSSNGQSNLESTKPKNTDTHSRKEVPLETPPLMASPVDGLRYKFHCLYVASVV